jgi:peptide/nickel transport system permease protein
MLVVPTLLGITVATFTLMHLAPGDPAELVLAGEGQHALDAQAVARFRAAYLLDQPLWRQYLHYLGPFDLSEQGHPLFGGSGARPYGGLLLGDLKNELHRPHVRVADELARRLAVTIPLAASALVLAYLIALPLGIVAALSKGRALERLMSTALLALYCTPAFLVGLGLQLLFGAGGLDWLPVLGQAEEGAPLGERLARAVLPVTCLAYGSLAYLSRQMRTALLEQLSADYVRAARARGLSERLVLGTHALRNALLPLATLFAGVFPALISGSVIVETIFDLPGVGRYAYEGLQQRDYFVVMATATLGALATCLGMLVSDLLAAALDPRIRHG